MNGKVDETPQTLQTCVKRQRQLIHVGIHCRGFLHASMCAEIAGFNIAVNFTAYIQQASVAFAF